MQTFLTVASHATVAGGHSRYLLHPGAVLQHLPHNICMVLDFTRDTIALEELVQPADRIMEVATLSVTAEVEQLRAVVNHLHNGPGAVSTRRKASSSCSGSPAPAHQLTHFSAGTIRNLAMLPASAKLPVLRWKSPWPVTNGNGCCWPTTKSPVSCYGPLSWPPLPCRHWHRSKCGTPLTNQAKTSTG